jgi:hypothetical protein
VNGQAPGTGAGIATTLRIIRVAMIGAVVGFAVLAGSVVQREGPFGFESPGALRLGNALFLLAAFAGIVAIQQRHAREPDPQRRQTLNVVAWAAGEMCAFAGIVHWLMVGSALPFYVGLGVMLAAFALVPIRE